MLTNSVIGSSLSFSLSLYLTGITSWCNGHLPIPYPLRPSLRCTMQFILSSSLLMFPITQVESLSLEFLSSAAEH
ncbi:hypothetical protein ASPBRDRAFT_38726 [Aspergillus brasiliensis CBS 101740]|uniref:Uncharacterized protein n=1 Tax=Aspergillus brasiliensis (strain CBS 101740 / IMI 381727 / IBT 21946) TaxID=767769 RepID=A0A1L9UX69_ASPBC|nr:hypothetical protein ASPBRDRAFT_38726 [Aspergillus brasiliensis CBS 101740]